MRRLASVNLLATAIKLAGSSQPDAVRAALANTRDFQGLVGKIAYLPGKRVPDKAVAVIKIDDGVETPVWTWIPPPPISLGLRTDQIAACHAS